MLDKTHSQVVGEGALAVQANRDAIFNVGLTFADVQGIVDALFEANFLRMKGEAGAIAEARAREVMGEFLARLRAEHPQALERANDPDFQYALFEVQKAVARSGDPNLQRILVELLVLRSKQPPRNLLQLVLGEAIEVAPRITNGQVNALTTAFIMRHVKFQAVATFDSFLKTMDLFLEPFHAELPTSDSTYSHLEYAGCGKIIAGDNSMASMLRRFYPGIFQSGVTDADVRIKGLSAAARGLLVQCEHDPGKAQVIGGTHEMLNAICRERALSEEDCEMLGQIFRHAVLTDEQIKDKCLRARPYFAPIFLAWDRSKLSGLYPSSVGIAIAHSRLLTCGEIQPLSQWIN